MNGLIIALAQTSSQGQSGAALAFSYIFYIFFIALLALSFFPGVQQKTQIMFLSRDVEQKLQMIEGYLKDSRGLTEKLLKDKGFADPKAFVDRIIDRFVIDPVSVEPTDIINRMKLLMRSNEDTVREMITAANPNIDPMTRSQIEISTEVVNALNLIYKVIRHYLIMAKKLNSIMIMYQLQMVAPIYVKYAEAYAKAQKVFLQGIPIGDGLGPLVASRFLMKADQKFTVSKDTIAGSIEFEGRKIVVVKAEGPMATVGTPGEGVQNVIEREGGRVSRIITVDAALKLEGEETGSVAEGMGVAMGDPGPEKIAIERVAVKYGIPIDAVIVKMSMEEAITEMRKEVYQAADKAIEYVKRIILERTKPGSTVVVVGVGNTAGIAQ
ncbi:MULTISPECIES: DUF1512 domain-containing protein [Metallosphaera]|uniref:DUF1512 domain-containing protein n=3 Tax=Metallosphaera TaxID=41980 RepID=A4YIL4_METS5|nr:MULTISPECIES: DUF1512 domain-containing protein [Metallosphaera]ABP96266.1 conserved hypothetical protein [Metallosphaera sedula DSM 5348]AIM28249.1 hypothetical protein HA72_2127 [Metallosphaera sedula]AKV75056.1 hypothetical protein MsedA_2176 [Metallosphaera sedula]AKV77295.1 hypothetical protein MsedB_2178 [Metallosphaera sedula]AKV79545.1 hypothetical protein MsedC_2176 [Metallosphaera sedula]